MKKKTLRLVGLLCLAAVAAAAVVAYRLYTKPHRSAATETAVVLTAAQLVQEYAKDETASDKKYLGNALQVSGTVSDVSVNQQNKPVVVLTGSVTSGVQCTLQDNTMTIKKGDSIIIKGFCAGMLTDVILDRCVVGH